MVSAFRYVQEFKKVARGSGYEGRPLIEEFKRGLNGPIRRKLAEAEKPPSTIGEWQKRAVRLDRNQRQSRAEERMLGRNTACPEGMSQTSFGHISINSPSILTVSMATESP